MLPPVGVYLHPRDYFHPTLIDCVPVFNVVLERAAQIFHVVPKASVSDYSRVLAPDRLANVHQVVTVLRKRGHLANYLDAKGRLLTTGGPTGTRHSRPIGLALLLGWRGHVVVQQTAGGSQAFRYRYVDASAGKIYLKDTETKLGKKDF